MGQHHRVLPSADNAGRGLNYSMTACSSQMTMLQWFQIKSMSCKVSAAFYWNQPRSTVARRDNLLEDFHHLRSTDLQRIHCLGPLSGRESHRSRALTVGGKPA
jgi:hypothetical protein